METDPEKNTSELTPRELVGYNVGLLVAGEIGKEDFWGGIKKIGNPTLNGSQAPAEEKKRVEPPARGLPDIEDDVLYVRPNRSS